MDKFSKMLKKTWLPILLALMGFGIVFSAFSQNEVKEITYIEFEQMVKDKKVKKVQYDRDGDTILVEDTNKKVAQTAHPNYEAFKKEMLTAGIDVEITDPTSILDIIGTLVSLIFPMYLVFLIYTMSKTNDSSKAEINFSNINTTLKDVAGHEEIKEDLKFVSDFIKDPDKYLSKGAEMPKGAVLYGPPGTGKTLLARAIAGEAGVPFFATSGSEFVQMFVGMGAKRVRDLFAAARKKGCPTIIFIDEIDAIGGARNGNSNTVEHNQTLNELLKQMDGFETDNKIFVICATNRVEMLDPALTRPGRFDKLIAVPLPSTKDERLAILNMYKEGKNFDEDIDFDRIAKETSGFSPAEIKSFINEAVLVSIIQGLDSITNDCVDEALEKIIIKGHAKKKSKKDKNESNKVREKERELIAWHEAGHTVMAYLKNMDVSKVTIIPTTTGAGGVTFVSPPESGLCSKRELEDSTMMEYAGRVAEYLLRGSYEDITLGASSDIRNATHRLQKMVVEWGMSDKLGMVNIDVLGGLNEDSIVLNEVLKLSEKLYKETECLLSKHKYLVKAIADELIEKDSLKDFEILEVINTAESIKNGNELFESETLESKEKVEIINAKKEPLSEEIQNEVAPAKE